MQVIFRGNPNPDANDERRVLEAWGKVFVLGEPVDISDLPEDRQARIARNSHFEVAGDAPKKRGRPRKVQEEEAAPEAETINDLTDDDASDE